MKNVERKNGWIAEREQSEIAKNQKLFSGTDDTKVCVMVVLKKQD